MGDALAEATRMRMNLRAYYCPCCGARLDDALTECAYCGARLEVDGDGISGNESLKRPITLEEKREEPVVQPEARLSQLSGDRFEMSLLFQGEKVKGEFCHAVEVAGGLYAGLYLRVVDKDQKTVAWSLPIDAVQDSLDEDRDPGLAANAALEALCEDPFPHALEIVIALFEPKSSRCTVYSAGCSQAIWWMSSEEGRSMTVDSYHPALEKKMLREQRDYFSAREPVYLASGDLLVMVSAAYCGRGEGPYGSGLNGLMTALNDNLGEDPLRVVTLAKNAFWTGRAAAARKQTPNGPIEVMAIQALPPEEVDVDVQPFVQQFGSELYEMTVLAHPEDWLELVPLHSQRSVLIWASNDGMALDAESQAVIRKAVVDVLGRQNHGDNENPRLAGRNALEACKVSRLAVIQLFDEWGRVKYFRSGWKQPLTLGPRKASDSTCSIQAFDEGGEATVPAGARLFFPGDQPYAGQTSRIEEMAQRWPGGKASLLYRALCDHWKKPKGAVCIERLACALMSDLGEDAKRTGYLGMALVTGKKL